MRKLFLILMMGALFVFPSLASAQSSLTFTNVNVQLWPEYDQPSMLVITDFQVSANATPPMSINFRIPKGANLIAVAEYSTGGSLVNAAFDGPKDDGDWQVFTIQLNGTSARFEYYQPLTFNGNQRLFSFLWDSEYAVDAFSAKVLEPLDVTSLTTTPVLSSIAENNGLKTYSGEPVKLASGEQYTLTLDYTKTTDSLVSAAQGVEPAQPVNEDTTGRISVSNYMPYIIGGLGVIMIIGGIVYYWRSGSNATKKSRRRAHSHDEGDTDGEDTYCPQCGTRSKSGDRFCRTCGARLRTQEE